MTVANLKKTNCASVHNSDAFMKSSKHTTTGSFPQQENKLQSPIVNGKIWQKKEAQCNTRDYYITRCLLQKLKTSGHLLLQSDVPGTN
jgi:hypothetical protein